MPDAIWKPDTPVAVRYGEIAAAEAAAAIELVDEALNEDATINNDVV